MNVTDTFNRADSATALGTTSDGSATWTALAGTWGISTNQAYCSTPAGVSVAYIDTGLANGTLQVTNSAPISSGLAFRIQDASNFLMFYFSSGSVFVYKWVGGAPTQLANYGAGASGDVLSVVLSGSSITAARNGTTLGTVTETAYQSLTKHGLVLATSSTTARWDTWSWVDGAAPPPPRHSSIVAPRRVPLIRASVR